MIVWFASFCNFSNNATSSAAEEEDFSELPQSSELVAESYSVKEIAASNITSPEKEYNQANQEDSLAPENSQNVVLQSTPSYPPVGLVPQLGNQITSFEGSDSQARDMSRLPSFLVKFMHYFYIHCLWCMFHYKLVFYGQPYFLVQSYDHDRYGWHWS